MKRKHFKPLLLSLSSLAVIAPVATVISCGSSTKDKVVKTPKSVETLVIEENPEKDNVWHADQSNSIVDALEQMNASMHIFFPKKLSDMTPFEFAQWLVDIYNNNGSGHMNMIVDYKGQQDKVVVDFKQPLLDVISTFKDAHISEDTPRSVLGTKAEFGAVVNRMLGSKGFLALLSGAHGFDKDLFLIPPTAGMIAELGIMDGTNPVGAAMLPLINPFPDSTMVTFIKIIDIFEGMSKGFVNSPVATQWAKDHNIEAEFKEIAHTMIREIMKRAVY